MPRLPFAVEIDPVDADPEPLPRGWASFGSLLGGPKPRRASGRRPSTALLAEPDTSAPVRTVDGTPLWRVRVGAEYEMTCRVCGETTETGRCYRCGNDLDELADLDGIETPMVPTLAYLKPGEYDLIRRSYQ